MKILIMALLFFTTAPSFADVISVSVPACFVYEFQALKSAVAQIKEKAIEFCSLPESDGPNPVIQNTIVEQNSSCNGFKISASVECQATN